MALASVLGSSRIRGHSRTGHDKLYVSDKGVWVWLAPHMVLLQYSLLRFLFVTSDAFSLKSSKLFKLLAPQNIDLPVLVTTKIS